MNKEQGGYNKRPKFNKRPYTHFISLPMFSNQSICKNYDEWKDKVLSCNYHETIIPKIFMRHQVIHYTLMMLPLETQDQVEQCKAIMAGLEPQIKQMILDRGVNGKLKLDFDQLDVFGTAEATRVIFMKLKQEGDQYQLLLDIIHIIVEAIYEKA